MAERDLLIVGAGPTGLTAAVELARRGIPLSIIDAKEGPTPLSKAVGISPHSLELLEASGLTERLLAKGIRVQQVGAWFDGRKLGQVDLSVLRHRFNFLLSLPQSETETVMANRLGELGVSVQRENSLLDLAEHRDCVRTLVEARDGRRTLETGFVYGADGADSTVRRRLGLEFEGCTHRRTWSIADIEFAKWPYDPAAAQAFLHASGDVGFVIPIGEHRFRAVSNTPDAIARLEGKFEIAEVLRTDTFHVPARQTTTFQKGRVFLGGDAAHAHSPLGARGMNLGIEDAMSFAGRFAAGELQGYTSERKPVARRWIELSERALGLVQSTNFLVVLLRNIVLRVTNYLPSLQRPLLRRVAGLEE